MERTWLAAAAAVVLGGSIASAGVLSFSLSTEAVTVAKQGASELDRQERTVNYPSSTSSYPIEAKAEIGKTDNVSNAVYSAFARSVANDPRYNSSLPTDFIMESAAGGVDSSITLSAITRATQTRKIELYATEVSPFSGTGPQDLVSEFVLDGGLALIVPSTASSAEGLTGVMSLSIKKGTNSLFSGSVTMTGQSDGSVAVSASGFGSRDYSVVPLHLTDLGEVWFVLFEDQPILFTYQARVGEQFELSATLTTEVTVPGGLGGGAAFGTVPAELVLLTEELFGAAPAPSAPAPEPGTVLFLIVGAAWLARRRATV